MVTQLNYYTNQEAYMKMCPEVKERPWCGSTLATPLTIPCIGSKCADWIFHDELTDEGYPQGRCGKTTIIKK